MPVADFTANITSGEAPLTVQFMDQTTGIPTTWSWIFGDSSSSNDQNPVHMYTAPGIYTVYLSVSNPCGNDTMIKHGYIFVSDHPGIQPWLILPNAALYQNTHTQIPIKVMNITNGTGLSFNVTYDPYVIRVNGVSLNQSYTSGSSLTVNSTPGLIRVSLSSTERININSPAPVLFLNTSGTGAVGSSTQLVARHAMWSDAEFKVRPLGIINSSILIYRIRGDLNGNGFNDIGDAAKTAHMVVGLTPELIPDADFNNNGRIDVGDSAKIAYYIVGLIPEL